MVGRRSTGQHATVSIETGGISQPYCAERLTRYTARSVKLGQAIHRLLLIQPALRNGRLHLGEGRFAQDFGPNGRGDDDCVEEAAQQLQLPASR